MGSAIVSVILEPQEDMASKLGASPEVDSDFEGWDNGIPTKYATRHDYYPLGPCPPASRRDCAPGL